MSYGCHHVTYITLNRFVETIEQFTQCILWYTGMVDGCLLYDSSLNIYYVLVSTRTHISKEKFYNDSKKNRNCPSDKIVWW